MKYHESESDFLCAGLSDKFLEGGQVFNLFLSPICQFSRCSLPSSLLYFDSASSIGVINPGVLGNFNGNILKK